VQYTRDELVVFNMVRETDGTGVSGEGLVAHGVRFPEPNGTVILAWVTEPHQATTVFDSIEAVEAIHGHGGDTKLIPIYRVDTGKP
jgi:hypothetical protein